MSVVSFIRTAGVTWLSTNSPSSMARTSLVLPLMSMMSTSPWATSCRIDSRNSAIVRNGPRNGSPPRRTPGAARPKAMSASLASARMKSWQEGSATIRASLRSSDFCEGARCMVGKSSNNGAAGGFCGGESRTASVPDSACNFRRRAGILSPLSNFGTPPIAAAATTRSNISSTFDRGHIDHGRIAIPFLRRPLESRPRR